MIRQVMTFAAVTALAVSIGHTRTAEAQHQLADTDFSMALTGDSIITRPLSVYAEPEFLAMIELIRSADVAFTNLEMLFHDYEPYPMAESGGTWMRGDPRLADDLVWAGFDLVALANNHSGDYGVHGMQLTMQYVSEAGLVGAGTGNSLAEAREAKFLETKKARVALISMASSYRAHMAAGSSRDNIPARPGLSPLRVSTTYQLPQSEFEAMRGVGEELGLFVDQDGNPIGTEEDRPGEIRLFNQWFAPGDVAAIRTRPNARDVEAIAAVVNNASRLADYVIVTIHAHQQLGRREIPAEFLQPFAHAMIDAGADVFVGHGPHVLRGIELYAGKPILYSLGDFMFQNETLQRLPTGNYERYQLDEHSHVADFNDQRYKNDTEGFPAIPEIWEAVIAVPVFRGETLKEMALYPITLGHDLPRQVRGRPLFADGDLAEKIIDDLRERSAPYGAEIEMRRGVGYLKID
jgi:poly-gamma-glutamate synthesis protein (capsule biosynthesis protein)